jgi:hypothetical protein
VDAAATASWPVVRATDPSESRGAAANSGAALVPLTDRATVLMAALVAIIAARKPRRLMD